MLPEDNNLIPFTKLASPSVWLGARSISSIALTLHRFLLCKLEKHLKFKRVSIWDFFLQCI